MAFTGSMSPEIEATAKAIVDSAYKVHVKFGPGLLESVYKECLALELRKRGHTVEREVAVPIYYEGIQLATPLRLDLLVDHHVIVEVKAVEKMIPLFKAQCVTYLKLTDKRLCMMINFNVELIRDGITRVAN